MRALIAIVLLFGVWTPAAAQDLADYDYENLSLRGIGFDYGHIWPNRVSATPAYSFRADLGYLGPGVRIVPSLTFWSSTLRRRELDRLAEQVNRLAPLSEQGVTVTGDDFGEIEWKDMSLALDAQFVWTTPLGVLTYVGLGAAVHAMNGQGAVIDNTFIEDLLDSFGAGVAIMGGAELDVAPKVRVYGELRYSIANEIRYPGVRIGGALMLTGSSQSTQLRR